MLVTDVPVKAAIYVRQSLENAEGIDRQLERCHSLASSRGWTVTEEFVDNAVSAAKVRKGAWLRLLEADVDVVIAVDLDRLLRSQKDLITLIESGLRLVTVDGEIDLSTADGEFRASMLAGIARFEIRRKGERSVRANAKRVADGFPIAGKTRFGYLGGNRKAHPKNGPIVLELFQRVRNGEATYKLAKEFNKDIVTLRGILTNRAYCGWVTRRDEWFAADPSVDRLITQELFDEVQTVLSDPSRKVSPGGQVAYLASGLARCGVCEGPLHSQSKNYLCTADLSHVCIKKELLDDVLCWEVFALISEPAQGQGVGELTALIEEQSEAFKRRAELTDLLTTPGIDKTIIKRKLVDLRDRLQTLEDKIAALRSEHIAADLIEGLKAQIDLLKDDYSIEADQQGADWWEKAWSELKLETRRELVRSLRVIVHKGRGVDRIEVSRV